MKPELVDYVLPALKFLRFYHQHQVVGLENIPSSGRALIVVNHSLATYDISLLFAAIYLEIGRIPRPLADRLFFKIPYMGELVEALGGKEGNPVSAMQLLQNGELVAVAPGGMHEALRPSTERYQLRWNKRTGFARLALLTETPVILSICPKADDLYKVYPSKMTNWVYEKFRIPLVFARGVGLSAIPRPVQLTHYVAPPIYPPKPKSDPKAFEAQLKKFHQEIVHKAQSMMNKAVVVR